MIGIRNDKEVLLMRKSGQLLAHAMQKTIERVQIGISLKELDVVAEKAIVDAGCTPSFKGYKQKAVGKPFPATLCASLNHEIVHGPASRHIILKDGDVLKLDLGLIHKGWFTDMAVTIPVGTISPAAEKLIAVTKDSLDAGILAAKPDLPLINVSNAIYKVIKNNSFGVVTGFCGHGVGKQVHEEPMIPNYPTPQAATVILKPGMTLALEPMVTMGNSTFEIADDGWTAYTKDESIAAHFEHTILITKNGAETLTIL